MNAISPIARCIPINPISAVAQRAVTWLWPHRLALGKLALIDGDPGLGKSLLTLDLCARLSTGRPFPDGVAGPGVSRSLVLNAEDSAADIARPHLEAMGADLAQVFVIGHGEAGDETPIVFPADAALLDRALTESRARLVVIDPITAFLTARTPIGNDASVRRALGPLAGLAAKHQCVMILVRHLAKHRGGTSALYRGTGSIGFQGLCRSSWLVARDPADPERRILANVKNNYAPLQSSLAFRLPALNAGAAALAWEGTVACSADEAMAGARAAPACGRPRARASDFLEAILRDGPRTCRAIWEAARAEGHTQRTLDRAKQDLDIRSAYVAVEGRPVSYWLLPGQRLPQTEPSDAGTDALDSYLEKLREQFPPSTPLDEL